MQTFWRNQDDIGLWIETFRGLGLLKHGLMYAHDWHSWLDYQIKQLIESKLYRPKILDYLSESSHPSAHYLISRIIAHRLRK